MYITIEYGTLFALCVSFDTNNPIIPIGPIPSVAVVQDASTPVSGRPCRYHLQRLFKFFRGGSVGPALVHVPEYMLSYSVSSSDAFYTLVALFNAID